MKMIPEIANRIRPPRIQSVRRIRVVTADRAGNAGDDDPQRARVREEAVAPDDAIHGVSEDLRIAGTGGVLVPEEPVTMFPRNAMTAAM